MSDTARCGAAEVPPVCRLFGDSAARLMVVDCRVGKGGGVGVNCLGSGVSGSWDCEKSIMYLKGCLVFLKNILNFSFLLNGNKIFSIKCH